MSWTTCTVSTLGLSPRTVMHMCMVYMNLMYHSQISLILSASRSPGLTEKALFSPPPPIIRKGACYRGGGLIERETYLKS